MNYAFEILEAFNKINNKPELLLEAANPGDIVFSIGNGYPNNITQDPSQKTTLVNQVRNSGDPNPEQSVEQAIKEAPEGKAAAQANAKLKTSKGKPIIIWKVEGKSSESKTSSDNQQENTSDAQQGGQQTQGTASPPMIDQSQILKQDFLTRFIPTTLNAFTQTFATAGQDFVQKLTGLFTSRDVQAVQMVRSLYEKKIENGKEVIKIRKDAATILEEASTELARQLLKGKVINLDSNTVINDDQIPIEIALPQIMETLDQVYTILNKETLNKTDINFIKETVKITTDDQRHQRALFYSKDRKFAISLPNTNNVLILTEALKHSVLTKYKDEIVDEPLEEFSFERLFTANRDRENEFEDRNIGTAIENLTVAFIQLNNATPENLQAATLETAKIATRIISFHDKFASLVNSDNAIVGEKKLIEQFSMFESKFLHHLELSEDFSNRYPDAAQKATVIKKAISDIVFRSKAMLEKHEIIRLANDSYSVGDIKKGLGQREDVVCVYYSKATAIKTKENYFQVKLDDPNADNILLDHLGDPNKVKLLKQRAAGKTKNNTVYLLKPSIKSSYTVSPTKMATASPKTTIEAVNILLQPPRSKLLQAPVIERFRKYIQDSSKQLGIDPDETKKLLEELKKDSQELLNLNTLVSETATTSTGGKPIKFDTAKEYANNFRELLKSHPEINVINSQPYNHMIQLEAAWNALNKEKTTENAKQFRDVLSKIYFTYKVSARVGRMNTRGLDKKLTQEAIRERRLLCMNLLVNSGSSDQSQPIIYVNPKTAKTFRVKHNDVIRNINSKILSGEAKITSSSGRYTITYTNANGQTVSYFVNPETSEGRTSYTYKATTTALEEVAYERYDLLQQPTLENNSNKYNSTLDLIESFLNNQKKLLMKLIEPEVFSSNLK